MPSYGNLAFLDIISHSISSNKRFYKTEYAKLYRYLLRYHHLDSTGKCTEYLGEDIIKYKNELESIRMLVLAKRVVDKTIPNEIWRHVYEIM